MSVLLLWPPGINCHTGPPSASLQRTRKKRFALTCNCQSAPAPPPDQPVSTGQDKAVNAPVDGSPSLSASAGLSAAAGEMCIIRFSGSSHPVPSDESGENPTTAHEVHGNRAPGHGTGTDNREGGAREGRAGPTRRPEARFLSRWEIWRQSSPRAMKASNARLIRAAKSLRIGNPNRTRSEVTLRSAQPRVE